MTTEQIKNSRFNAFSILELENKKKVIIFLCETKEMADNLYRLLSTKEYKLTIGISQKKEYRFEIDFLSREFKFQFDTKLTAEEYPPLLWLTNSTVSLVTTGIKGQGQQRYWNDNYLQLIRQSLN